MNVIQKDYPHRCQGINGIENTNRNSDPTQTTLQEGRIGTPLRVLRGREYEGILPVPPVILHMNTAVQGMIHHRTK